LFADFLAQRSADAHPCAFKLLPDCNSSISSPATVFVRYGRRYCCADNRRLNSVHVCLTAGSDAFHPPAAPALGLRIQGAFKSICYIENMYCSRPGTWLRPARPDFRLHSDREQQAGSPCPGGRPRKRGSRIPDWAALLGKDMPFSEAAPAFFASCSRSGRPDIIPFGARWRTSIQTASFVRSGFSTAVAGRPRRRP